MKLFKEKNFPIVLQVIFDLLAFILCVLFFYLYKFDVQNQDMTDFLVLSGIFAIFWHVLFFFSGLYKNWYAKSPFDEIYTILKVNLFGYLFIIFVVIYGSSSSPRLHLIAYYGLFSGLVITGRIVTRYIQKLLLSKNMMSIPTVIIGTAHKASSFYRKTKLAKLWGYDAKGVIITSQSELDVWGNEKISEKKNIPLLGEIKDLEAIISQHKLKEVIISTEKPKHSLLVDIVALCGEKNVRVNIEPDLYDIFTGQARAQSLYGIPLIEISTQLLKPWQEMIKRLFDIFFSAMIIMLGMPFWILLSICIKIESFQGSIFYTQPRVGKDGKVFKIFKFRSMIPDADKQKKKWTSVNDKRVTKFGKFIRKSHLDEVPQFWNVLIGDMSVVGPRPEQPQYVEEFSNELHYYKRRLKVRPGITGWWQVKYQAHELNVEEIKSRLKDDFYYIENMSIKLDIEIIIRTVWVVLKGHGQA